MPLHFYVISYFNKYCSGTPAPGIEPGCLFLGKDFQSFAIPLCDAGIFATTKIQKPVINLIAKNNND